MAFRSQQVRQAIQDFDFQRLFIEELGWDNPPLWSVPVEVDGRPYRLDPVAEKAGMVAYAHRSARIPVRPLRMKIERKLAKAVYEHLIVFVDHADARQVWQWVRRQAGDQPRYREHTFYREQSGELLAQKLQPLAFDIEDEPSIAQVTGRARRGFDIDRVTKRFYTRFKTEHDALLEFVEGIPVTGDREWYTSLMLNRLMFVYFVQKKGFLDNDPDYLRTRLTMTRQQQGSDRFFSFYRHFLRRFFHEGLGQPPEDRDSELDKLIGDVPYLDGGIFDVHELERDYPEIEISDHAFERLFDFFDAYDWRLDDRPLRADNEVNPDVLGYIFEKYVNQKQMGAYYTKEDITGYIAQNTVIPRLFDMARKDCAIAFRPSVIPANAGIQPDAPAVWRLLREDPDRYIYASVRRGVDVPLPAYVADGVDDVAQRGRWNEPADDAHALPTETWREHVARRQRHDEVWEKLVDGKVQQINDLITLNLDIRRFAQDVILDCEGPELLRAFWKAIRNISVLDPACGSGAFLFAALNVLEPLYDACLERMEAFVAELEQSGAKHSPAKFSDFREYLREVQRHPNRRYYILKSIIIGNLYGVDIMEEAVEICKLRLFLKLAAQAARIEELEPLPDIDFNIRSGNSLAGFTSLDAVRQAMTVANDSEGQFVQSRAMDAEQKEILQRIEDDAEIASQAFARFRDQQTSLGGEVTPSDKSDLRRSLASLGDELDHHLASEYGLSPSDSNAYKAWRASHQPFHWFVEFYDIMHQGGFDVVVGNPPYVEYSKVRKTYQVKSLSTHRCGNIYAPFTERGLNLLGTNRRFGFIVQAPIVSTQRMSPLRALIHKRANFTLYATFDDRPSKLFQGMDHCRVCIVLSRTSTYDQDSQTATTRYHKWYKEESPMLLELLRYESFPVVTPSAVIPKLRSKTELNIYNTLLEQPKTVGRILSTTPTKNRIYYKITGVGHWFTFTTTPPKFWRDGVEGSSTRENSVCFPNALLRDTAFCCLWSTLHYWLYQARTNCRDFNPSDLESLPIPNSVAEGVAQFQRFARRISHQLDQTSDIATATYNVGGRVRYQRFSPGLAKPIIDEIDRVLAKHYGFTDEELDFIINYDIKYRMGQEG